MGRMTIHTICWVLLALIHMPPAAALFQPELLSRLYGVDPQGELGLLLRHRAALFLGVAVLCGWSALRPAIRRPAVVLTGISVLGFLVLYGLAGMPLGALRTIAIADLLAVPILAWVAWQEFRPPSKP